MHRNVTAIYRTHDVAELVRQGLEEIGIPANDIHVIPDSTGNAMAGGRTAGIGAGIAPTGTPPAVEPASEPAGREHPLHHASMLEAGAEEHIDRLYDLELPEEDLRAYQHAVREGDHVVSVEVEGTGIEQVKAVMRRPEAETYDIEHRASQFRSHDLIAHSAGEGRHTLSEEYRARRLTPGAGDEFARTYERNRRLDRF